MPRPETILVVGAGPVGLTAALELTRRGFRPRIVDKASGPAGESRALGVHARTLDILKPAGVTQKLLAAGNEVRRIEVRENGTPSLTLDFARLGGRFPFILGIPQATTERFLIEALHGFGTNVEWNVELTTFEDADRPRVTLRGPAGAETVTPDLVIGADGAHSAVRKACGIGFAGEQMPARFGLADIRYKTRFDPHLAVARILPDGVLGFIPLSDTTGRYFCNHADILPLLPHQDDIADVVWQSDFSISYRLVETFQKGRVFLAGDAAHIHSPLGARGMNTGIEDAAWLAWLIDTGNTEGYSRDRLPVARAVLALTHQQTRQILDRRPIANFVRRRLAAVALAVPPVARFALRRMTGADTPYPPWLASA